ncbi:Colistin resistance protein EmrA [uncultured Gammaproteobacteria bacterium]
MAMAVGRRKLVLTGLALAAVSGAGWAAWMWWHDWRFLQSTDDAYVQADVTVISSRVSGYVREVLVADNQEVAAGTVLVAIDDADFRARVAEAEAAIEARKAALVSNSQRRLLQQALIEQAAAALASAEAEKQRSTLDFQRVRALAGDSFASRQRFETVDADMKKAEAAVNRARAAQEAERAQIGVLNAARSEIEASLHQGEAMLTLVRIDLDNTRVRAPVAGVIGNRTLQVGVYARPGVQMMAVVPLTSVYVSANFKETQLAKMRPGQPATLNFDAWPGESVTGRVDSLSPASGSRFSLLPPENATGNFTKIVQRVPVKITLPTGHALSGRLRPGLSAVVEVDTRNPGP